MKQIHLIALWLEEKVDRVVGEWLSKKEIQEIFLKYHINLKKIL